MFEKLYLVLTSCFFLFLVSMTCVGYLRSETPGHEHRLMEVCISGGIGQIVNTHESGRSSIIGLVLPTIFISLLIILYFQSRIFVKNNSKDNQVPVKYGRYKRNILSYQECIGFCFANFLKHFVSMILVNFFSDQHLKFIYHYILSANITSCVVNCVILPLYILIRVKKFFPDFFKNKNKVMPVQPKIFFMTPNSFEPRRQNAAAEEPERNNFVYVIKVKEYESDVL